MSHDSLYDCLTQQTVNPGQRAGVFTSPRTEQGTLMTHEALLRAQLAHVRATLKLAAAMERLTDELTRDHPVEVTRRRAGEPGDYGAAASSRP